MDGNPPLHPDFYKALLLHNPIAVVITDLEARVITCNPAFEKLFGYSVEECAGQLLDSLVATQEGVEESLELTRRTLVNGEMVAASGIRRRKDGSLVDVEMLGVPVFVEGRQIGVLSNYTDVTQRKQAERNLREFYASFINVMDSIDADVYVSDMETYQILFMNQHMRQSFGGDFVGRICYKVFRNEANPCGHCTNAWLLDRDGNPTGVYEWECENPITHRWYKNFDRAIRWEGGRFVRLQIATDISEMKEVEKRLEHLATHDPLTDLPNRSLFQDRLSHALSISRRDGLNLAVLFLDLDGFKQVNDLHGHQVGDLLLKLVALRMRQTLRDSDTLARVSGDEFAIILERLPSQEAAGVLAKKICKAIREPFQMGEREIGVSASIGISLFPRNGETVDQLLAAADQAMYEMKKKGKDGYLFAVQSE